MIYKHQYLSPSYSIIKWLNDQQPEKVISINKHHDDSWSIIYVSKAEPTYTLQDLLDAWDAGQEMGETQTRRDFTDRVSNYDYEKMVDKTTYFKQKHNISLP